MLFSFALFQVRSQYSELELKNSEITFLELHDESINKNKYCYIAKFTRNIEAREYTFCKHNLHFEKILGNNVVLCKKCLKLDNSNI